MAAVRHDPTDPSYGLTLNGEVNAFSSDLSSNRLAVDHGQGDVER